MAWVQKFNAGIVSALLMAGGLSGAAHSQEAPAATAPNAGEDAVKAATLKFNAYVGFMNRTLRAVSSLDRYHSWVNMKTGPTGRESIIYGLYDVYDTKGEEAKATAALTQEPLLPELDAAMRDYIAANAELAPVLREANGYYERADYKVDKMAEGKLLHARIVAAAKPFVAARARADAVLTTEKAKVDLMRLAVIEKNQGRKANWQVANVMMKAQHVMDLLPGNARPVIDIAPFDAAMADYGAAVKEMDTYGAASPNSFSAFESQPRTLLSKLRDFQEKLDRAKGDARHGAGGDMTWIVNDYNMMVTTSRNATIFSH